jgi:hypothetical protein
MFNSRLMGAASVAMMAGLMAHAQRHHRQDYRKGVKDYHKGLGSSCYMPHQGKRECERRRKRMEAVNART